MKSEQLERLRSIWNNLAPRERQLAIAGGVVIGILLLYMLLWRPVQKELARLRVSVPQERTQLQQMRLQAATIRPLRARSGSAPGPGMLLSVVDQSATARGVRGLISRLEAEGSTGVQLNAEAMPFNSFISWLAELQDSYALIVDNASMDAQSASGTVNIKMKLRTETP